MWEKLKQCGIHNIMAPIGPESLKKVTGNRQIDTDQHNELQGHFVETK